MARAFAIPLPWRRLAALIAFGVAFGLVEAVVVYYLRQLSGLHGNYALGQYHTILNLGFIAFIQPAQAVLIRPHYGTVEVFREAATIVMLASVAYVAAGDWRGRLGAFLVAFATWDIMYYAFLWVLTGWPASLTTIDIYFLIPVVWVGPVITPLVISTSLFIGGTWLYLKHPGTAEF